MPNEDLAVTTHRVGAISKVASAILALIGQIPSSKKRKSGRPEDEVRDITSAAAAQAAVVAGTLALPLGPLGWLTVLPELIAVWRIQVQMVADIAALHGRSATLTREHMLYCMFRHTAAQAVRDLAVRVGDRLLVRPASIGLLQQIAQRIGIHLTQRVVRKGLSRWLPIVGALGVAAYAYHDTAQVSRVAVDLFSGDMDAKPHGPKPLEV